MTEENYTRFTGGLFDENLQNEQLEFESEIDLLYNEVEKYRSSEEFQKILDFCCNFKHIAPFNAMLVNIQKPGSEMVLTAYQWEKLYGRKLKPNAQPLIYLNMMPVGALYDIGDTLPIKEGGKSDKDIIDEIAHPFSADGKFNENLLKTLVDNLQYFGIAHDFSLNASSQLAAQIEPSSVDVVVKFTHRGHESGFRWQMPYLISINSQVKPLQRMQSLCHELGHFFCHHLPPVNEKWWKKRRHDHIIREFEAETVAYMVCKRNGIPLPDSKGYLAGYAESNKEIPHNISVEAIMKAVNSIENMLTPLSWSGGLLYDKDPLFKNRLQEERKRIDLMDGRG